MSIQIVTDERLAQLEKHLVAQVILNDRSPTFNQFIGPRVTIV